MSFLENLDYFSSLYEEYSVKILSRMLIWSPPKIWNESRDFETPKQSYALM